MKRVIFFIFIILLLVSSQFTGTISVKQNDLIADILIYKGPGAWSTGISSFEKFVEYKDLTWFEGDHDYINNNDLVGNFNVIYIPGGSAGTIIDSFNIFGYQHIRDFVSSGGGYIGICGGGYVASDKIIWEGNSYNPPLDLFPGTAFGSIHEIIPYPQYKMTNISINLSNPINIYEPDSESILYYGGAAFYPDEGQEINIIGTYDSFNNDPAIINFNYGEGRVVLFGPHPEIEEDSDRDGETFFHFLEDDGTDWNLLWTSMDWLLKREISEPPISVQPDRPDIKGMLNGNIGIEYNYTIFTNDPDSDQVYFFVDWDDNSVSEWFGPYNSGERCQVAHSWDKVGNYRIRVKAKDTNDLESDWSNPLIVSIPRNKLLYLFPLLFQFLEEHPRLFPLLRLLLKL